MFILFILSVIAELVLPNGGPTAATIFFSLGPIIYDVDYFVKKWQEYQKMRKIQRKMNFTT